MPPLAAAAVLGAGGGLRSFAPPAVLAARGRGPFSGAARFIAFGAAAGEIIADKQPNMPSRWGPRGLSLRLAFSSAAGRDLAGPAGAGVAALTALGAARAGSAIRGRLAEGPAAFPAAVLEDALSYTLVGIATRTTS
jgi:uncharacterized membrane protein